MATKFRLPASGAAPVSPAIQSYSHTQTTRRPLPTSDSTALANQAYTPDGADHLAAGDAHHVQFVSAPIAVQNLSAQTVKLNIQAFEAHANNNLFIQVWIGLYSNDGSSLLATLLAKSADNNEIFTSLRSITHSATTTGYNMASGDAGARIVVEISVTGTPTAAGGVQGHNATLRFGSDGAGGDLADDDTQTGTTLNPFIEFANTILFQPTLTDVETTEEFKDKQTNVTATGTNFEAAQGGGAVELGDNATYASANKETQTVTSWSDTSIDFTANLGALTPGALFLFVTTNGGSRVSIAVTVHRSDLFVMAASSHITASGENTTAQLTAPSGKTTADFGGGRIQDDENPGDAVDLGSGDYREDEWSIQATADVEDSAAYQFRVVLASGAALDTYSVTPQFTVSTAVSAEAGPVVVQALVVAPSIALNATPAPVAANVSVVAPAATLGQNITPDPTAVNVSVVAPALALALTPAPTAVQVQVVAPSLALALTPAPVVTQVQVVAPAESLALTPAPTATAVSVVAPSVALNLTPAAVAVQVTIAAPSLALALTPAATAVQVSVVAPSVTTGIAISPDPVVVQALVVAPSLAMSLTLTPVVVEVSIVAPSLTTPITVTPDPVVVQAVVVAPSLALALTPAAVAVQVSIVGPTVTEALSLTPDPTSVNVQVIAPSLTLALTPTPTTTQVSIAAITASLALTPAPTTTQVQVVAAALALALTPSPVQTQATIVAAALLLGLSPPPTSVPVRIVAPTLSGGGIGTFITPDPVSVAVAVVALSIGISPVAATAYGLEEAITRREGLEEATTRRFGLEEAITRRRGLD